MTERKGGGMGGQRAPSVEREPRMIIGGWSLVGLIALAVAASVAAAALAAEDIVDGTHLAIRVTARASVTLFLLAFTASALWRFWPNRWTRWQLKNRRYLGVSFAAAHFMHLGAIAALGVAAPAELRDTSATTLVGGGLAYLVIALMMLTSFDRSAAWIGERAWTGLHTAGTYYVWLIFANSYGGRAFTLPEYRPIAVLLVLALLARLGRRLAGPRSGQRSKPTPISIA